jgi:hypothetical protein
MGTKNNALLSISTQSAGTVRLRRQPTNVTSSRAKAATPLISRPEEGLPSIAKLGAVVVIVSTELTAPPFGVTLAGAKLHVDSEGSPEHAKVIV